MDLVGERWTLLIVRELLFGPRRYKDIMKGLPGIGTNLLSSRLKKLEEAAVIEKLILPPPAGSTVYRLTSRGEELRPSIAALADWGLALMKQALDDDFLGVVPTMSALVTMFDGHCAGEILDCELHVGEEVFRVVIEDGDIVVKPGTSPSPDIVISGEPKSIVGLLGRPDHVQKSVSAGSVALPRGGIQKARLFFSRFHPVDSSN
jgi:DNA-binding HxlR family transcriptional regulator